MEIKESQSSIQITIWQTLELNCKEIYTDSVTSKYNKSNKGKLEWKTLRESLIASVNEIIPRKKGVDIRWNSWYGKRQQMVMRYGTEYYTKKLKTNANENCTVIERMSILEIR